MYDFTFLNKNLCRQSNEVWSSECQFNLWQLDLLNFQFKCSGFWFNPNNRKYMPLFYEIFLIYYLKISKTQMLSSNMKEILGRYKKNKREVWQICEDFQKMYTFFEILSIIYFNFRHQNWWTHMQIKTVVLIFNIWIWFTDF